MDAFTYFISALLIAFVSTDISAAWLLLRGAAKASYSLVALNERATVAALQATSGALLGLLGANRILEWHMHEAPVLIMLSLAMLLQAMPSIIWLSLYFKHKFGN